MQQPKYKCQSGSAVVEFIVFVLFGQLLVFSGGMQLASWVDAKLKLELAAHQVARGLSLGKGDLLLELANGNFGNDEIRVSEVDCNQALICIIARSGNLSAAGISVRNGI